MPSENAQHMRTVSPGFPFPANPRVQIPGRSLPDGIFQVRNVSKQQRWRAGLYLLSENSDLSLRTGAIQQLLDQSRLHTRNTDILVVGWFLEAGAVQPEQMEPFEGETMVRSESLDSERPIQPLRPLLECEEETLKAPIGRVLFKRVIVSRNEEDVADGQAIEFGDQLIRPRLFASGRQPRLEMNGFHQARLGIGKGNVLQTQIPCVHHEIDVLPSFGERINAVYRPMKSVPIVRGVVSVSRGLLFPAPVKQMSISQLGECDLLLRARRAKRPGSSAGDAYKDEKQDKVQTGSSDLHTE